MMDQNQNSIMSENYSRQKYSPLFHVKFPLSLFSTLQCFFPLSPTTNVWDDFKFHTLNVWIQYAFTLLLSFIISFACGGYLMYKYSYMPSGLDLLSGLDFVLFGAITVAGPIVLQVSYLIVFQKKNKNIGDLCRKISYVTFNQEKYFGTYGIHKPAKTKSQNMILAFILMTMANVGLAAVYNYLDQQIFNDNPIPTSISLIGIPLQFIAAFFGMGSPLIISAPFLSIYLICHVTQNINSLKEIIKRCTGNANKSEQTEQTNYQSNTKNLTDIRKVSPSLELKSTKFNQLEIDIVVNMGTELCNVVSELNSAFSGINFWHYTMYLMSAIVNFYLTFLIFGILGWRDVQNIPLIMMNLVGLIASILAMYYMISCGDDLAKSMNALKCALEDYVVTRTVEDYNFEDANEKFTIYNKIDLLKERLNIVSPISPYGLFGINNSSCLESLVNILTYVVVIINFKITEPQ